ncbi:dehydrogenase/reductase SDR family member 7 [Anabrus simplex]|uniref:dehydrogenase/reductase SDR family member 7 n=1 Tax=Anabrus simplex TaxID=316456 RepID=UPI0034DDA596
MDFFTFIGLLTFIYFVVYIVVLLLVDCDLALAWSEKFGKSVDSLRGKVVWVTGASSGIGEHMAYALARGGVKLVLSARRVGELERVKAKCLEVGSHLTENDVLVLPFDITAYATHQESFDKVIKHFGTLDILVNNAGRSQRAMWEDIETEVDREMFEVNVFGIVSLSRIAVRYFLKKGEGHIAVTSSLAGVLGVPFSGTYTGTKHAIHGFFNSLWVEKLGCNIHRTLLCPGPVHTNFLAESFTDKAGVKFGQQVSSTDRRLSSERCGYLSAVALANRLPEVWIALFPLIPLTYLVYFPNIAKIVMSYIGPKQFLKLRDTKDTLKTK